MEEEKIMAQSIIDNLNKDLERKYMDDCDMATWKMDWNMLLYTPEEESGFQLDWNKLIYNEEQLAEFYLQKTEKMIKPDKYEYLFENPSERSAMEKYYLKMAGYDVDEKEETDEDLIVKRLIVNGMLREA
jgi:hypothetical protein